MVDFMVDAEGDCTSYDVVKVPESKPHSDVTTSFMLFRVTCGYGTLDAPEEAGTDATCPAPKYTNHVVPKRLLTYSPAA